MCWATTSLAVDYELELTSVSASCASAVPAGHHLLDTLRRQHTDCDASLAWLMPGVRRAVSGRRGRSTTRGRSDLGNGQRRCGTGTAKHSWVASFQSGKISFGVEPVFPFLVENA